MCTDQECVLTRSVYNTIQPPCSEMLCTHLLPKVYSIIKAPLYIRTYYYYNIFQCECVYSTCVYCLLLLPCPHPFSPPPAESIGNASGLGFSGYDKKGNPQWETCKNCKPITYEVSMCVYATCRTDWVV